ncbi:Ribosomal protein L7Ae [Proteiniborus ethanoligenes]|uniref:Ribosomal protein L7Ae n=1 Tax=Proteiniborus ethanoligenes TaxID=415015 RepID=A0A1H3N726_9FIRM|nr:ribosomal L7Ae/L30e/S12e/Gadd45 family protein [Proteiniborus ethanoligenes]TAH63736.1 MAG: 50S ribosomal protein L7ae [Gottschalkiaceae bacterium]SDY84543.1 Ribosomal protein L7Ae [Proteiniborus ethanoligenes]
MKKLLSMLGIGRKAGLIVSGEMGCIHSLKDDSSKLLIIALDASDNTKNKFKALCNNKNITYVEIGSKAELGLAIGKGITSVISINDEAFSKALYKIIDEIITCK